MTEFVEACCVTPPVVPVRGNARGGQGLAFPWLRGRRERERERETYMGEAKFDRLYFCYAPEVMWNEGGRRLLFIESCRLYNQSSFKPKVDAAT